MPSLESSKLWGGGDTPIKFDLWYDCARDPNNGKVTYCVYARIKALTSSQGRFGYPINMEVSIKKSTDSEWSKFNWVKTGDTYCDFKESSPINWNQDIQYNTSNKQITASPGENVQLKLRIYSNGASAVKGRDITFTYSNLVVPALQAARLASVGDFVVATNAAINITIDGYNANYTYGFEMSRGGVTPFSRSAIAFTPGTGTTATASPRLTRTNRSAIWEAMSDTDNATFLCTLITKSGDVVIGTSSSQCVCTVGTDIKPSTSGITFERVCKEGVTDPGVYMQDVTAVKVTAVNASVYGSSGTTISHYVIGIWGDSYTVKPSDLPVVLPLSNLPSATPASAPRTLSITVSTYDARGHTDLVIDETTTPATVTPGYIANPIKVWPYHAPQITNYTSTRCNVNGADDVNGQYFRADVTTDYQILNETWRVTLTNNGNSSYAEIKYNDQWYFTEGEYLDVPDGAEITCYISARNTGSGSRAFIMEDNRTIAGAAGGSFQLYTYTVRRNIDISFSVGDYVSYLYINTAESPVNEALLKIEYKQSTSTTWTTALPDSQHPENEWFTLSSAPFSSIVGNGSISTSSSYDVRYTIKDSIYTTGISVLDYLSSAEFTIFLPKGGKGVSIGEVYTPTGSDKVLNISDDWNLSRGGQPAVREDSSGWVIHDLGGGYIEMWKEIDCSNVSGWTLWGSGIYYSTTQFNEYYPYQITFDGAPFVTATVRTYYTSATNHPNLWLVTDAQSSSNTESEHTEMTPTYVLARVGTLGNAIDAKIAIHVMGKLVSS